MKNILYSGIVGLTLLLTGCGNSDEAASCRFDVQLNLDSGNFEAVIAELTNPSSACYDAYNGDEWQIDLGAAYMGRAGLGTSDIIGLIGVEDGTGNSTLETFIDSVIKKQTSTALPDLKSASSSYTTALGVADCASPLTLTNSQKDICLYRGLADTMLTSTTISYLLDDISTLFDDTDTLAQAAAQEEMDASMCALIFSNDGSTCAEASTVVPTDVTFTYEDNSTRDFRDIAVTINGNEYHRLATATAVTPGTTIVTDGYCDNFFANETDTWVSPLYACPLNRDSAAGDESVLTLLTETLASGLDGVEAALSGDPELQQDITDYKLEVDPNDDDNVTLTEIDNYLDTL